MRYFLKLAYHGKNYCGWQRQENAIAVQQVLEEKLQLVIGYPADITGCGRTDAGVHAHQYFAHFDVRDAISDTELFIYKFNALLPDSIAIYACFPVVDDLHARFSASSRSYKYFMHYGKNPFRDDFSFSLQNKRPDIQLMNQCCRHLLGEYDFSTFEKKGSDNKTSVCNLTDAHFTETEDGIVFTITANRFLRNMVRRITGAMLMVGLNQLKSEELITLVRNQQTLNVKIAVPAKGLFLWEIIYPNF
ncbi:MAG TPA: tRNA pseudouridine(38-40) synthase TruA [Chitinophagales bacterium]|nr:tRNA pseudouridine(38-40) synthase TruA [Chitinophagales bacterium]